MTNRDLVLDADIHPSITFLAKIFPASKKEDNIEAVRDQIEEAISAEKIKIAIKSIFISFNKLEKFVRNTFTANEEIEKTLNVIRRL